MCCDSKPAGVSWRNCVTSSKNKKGRFESAPGGYKPPFLDRRRCSLAPDTDAPQFCCVTQLEAFEISNTFSYMKRFFLRTILLLCLAFFLNACESTGDTASDNPIKTGGAVPGEKTADEPVSATGGPGSAGAGVRW